MHFSRDKGEGVRKYLIKSYQKFLVSLSFSSEGCACEVFMVCEMCVFKILDVTSD